MIGDIGVVSYCWLTPQHPDPEALQLSGYLRLAIERHYYARDYKTCTDNPSRFDKDLFGKGYYECHRVEFSKNKAYGQELKFLDESNISKRPEEAEARQLPGANSSEQGEANWHLSSR